MVTGVEMAVGLETEQETQPVDRKQDGGDLERKPALDHRSPGLGQSCLAHGTLGGEMEDRRHHEPDRGQCQEGRSGGRGRPVEGLAFAADPAGQH